MELRQLRYLTAVAEERSFTRAAERLYIAQSAVSHQIVKLEAELGVQLLSRSSRLVEPTHAGELVVARARRILTETAAIEGEIAALQGLVCGRVGLGGMLALGPLDIAQLLGSFHRRYEGVEVKLVVATTRDLHARVHREELDLAVSVEVPGLASRDISGERLFDEELVAVLPPDHPLGTSESPLATSELAPYPFLGYYPGSATREAIDKRLNADGVLPRTTFESSDAGIVRRLVSHGLGVAILARSTVSELGPPIVVRSLRPRLTCGIALIWRTDRVRSPAANALLEHIRQAASAQRI